MGEWKWIAVGLALAAAVVLGLIWYGQSHQQGLELTILHTNDVHAHYEPFQPWGEPVQGGAARLATAIRSIRAEGGNTLLLDAGDQFQGTLFYNVGGATVVADVMNALSYDAMCLGNHEFDAGPSETAALIAQADFPVLSANTDSTADPVLAGMIDEFATFEFEQTTVAVIGLTTDHTAVSSNPGPRIVFTDVVETAQDLTGKLEQRGVNKIIALTHLGYERDKELAAAVEGIDIIVGGHSHTQLGDTETDAGPYPTLVRSPSGEPVLVVTADEWGRVLGRLDVRFAEDGVIVHAMGTPLLIDETIPEDSTVLSLLEPYAMAISELKAQAVGATDVPLNGDRADVRSGETNLGNLVCDAMLWKARAFGAEIAIQNGGGIRASVPAGIVTMGNVLEILPFGNQLTVLELSGAALLDALENGVSRVEEGSGQFPHVAGLRFAFDASEPPGQRIQQVEVRRSGAEAFVPLEPDAAYVIVTNSFLAHGGDGYESLASAGSRYDSGFLLSDALAEHLETASPVSPGLEGRILGIDVGSTQQETPEETQE